MRIVIFLLIVSGLLLCRGCTSQKIKTIQYCDNFSEGSVYGWGGTHFECRLYRKGGGCYLESRLHGTYARMGNTFVKYLGENIELDRRGLFFGNDGRMHVEYFDHHGKKHEASVPFGDIHGDKHVSLMPPRGELPRGPFSKKYNAAGITKEEEHIIEEFLPTLQKHVRNDDAEAISKMLIYPITARVFWLENRQDFLKYYPQIFTKVVKENLLKLQNKDIFCNYKGLMINYGMWFCLGADDKAYFYALNHCEY